MDKNTFGKYGWLVIVVIIICILLGASYGLVHLIEVNVKSDVNKFKGTQGGALDNITKAESFDDINSGSGGEEEIEVISVEPGLYKTGSNYTELITPWSTLIADGTIHLNAGVVSTNCVGAGNNASNDSSDALAGDLFLPNDGSVTALYGSYSTDAGAFKDCAKLTGIIIPEGVTVISECSFEGCVALESIGTMGSGASVIIPSTVTEIARYAFYSCDGLIKVDIPGTVKYIGGMESPYGCAFNGCDNIATLMLHEGLERIGRDSFSGCKNLTTVYVPNSVSELGAYAFSACQALTTITFGPNCQIPEINGNTFSYCSNLLEIELPDTVTEIGGSAFYSCSKLQSVKMPDEMSGIGAYAFRDCSKLSSIIIPEGVTEIKDETFSYCYALTSVEIPSSVTKIGASAFTNCSKLNDVSLPEGLTKIGDSAFNGCSGLTNFEFKGTTTQWNSVSKGSYWRAGLGTSRLTCSDGKVYI